MAKRLVSDELWARVEPLIPKRESPSEKGGRPPVGDRAALTGIMFVLKTGIPWEDLPREMGCGCGMTCWRRLRDWEKAGVWKGLHEIILAELNADGRIDWSAAAVDSGTIRAVGGGEKTGPNPTDRGRPGCKHHIVTDGQGIPLQVELTGANTPDIKEVHRESAYQAVRMVLRRLARAIHPTNSNRVSWMAKILSLKNAWSRKP